MYIEMRSAKALRQLIRKNARRRRALLFLNKFFLEERIPACRQAGSTRGSPERLLPDFAVAICDGSKESEHCDERQTNSRTWESGRLDILERLFHGLDLFFHHGLGFRFRFQLGCRLLH